MTQREIELQRLRSVWTPMVNADMSGAIVAKYKQDNSSREGGMCTAPYLADLYNWIISEWPDLDIENRDLGRFSVHPIDCGKILFGVAKEKKNG